MNDRSRGPAREAHRVRVGRVPIRATEDHTSCRPSPPPNPRFVRISGLTWRSSPAPCSARRRRRDLGRSSRPTSPPRTSRSPPTPPPSVGQAVDTPWEAFAAGRHHQPRTLSAATDGKTYAELDKEDPLRAIGDERLLPAGLAVHLGRRVRCRRPGHGRRRRLRPHRLRPAHASRRRQPSPRCAARTRTVLDARLTAQPHTTSPVPARGPGSSSCGDRTTARPHRRASRAASSEDPYKSAADGLGRIDSLARGAPRPGDRSGSPRALR